METRLPKNTSHLCAAVGSDDHLYVVGDVVGKLDLKTEEWKSIPSVMVTNIFIDVLLLLLFYSFTVLKLILLLLLSTSVTSSENSI